MQFLVVETTMPNLVVTKTAPNAVLVPNQLSANVTKMAAFAKTVLFTIPKSINAYVQNNAVSGTQLFYKSTSKFANRITPYQHFSHEMFIITVYFYTFKETSIIPL